MIASGLISGLDTRSLVAQLGQVERQPAVRLGQKQAQYRSQISSLGTISSQLSDLKNTLKDTDSLSEFLASTGTSKDEEVVTIEASGSAAQATYKVRVDQLAQAEKDRSAEFGSVDSLVKEGTMTLQVYGEDSIDVAIEAGDTLGDVRDKIAQSGAKVEVSVIQTGTGARLSITSAKSGYDPAGEGGLVDQSAAAGNESNALIITESYTGGSGTELGMTEIETAQNALIEIDGLAIASTSNRVSGALEGVALTLESVSTDPVEVAVAADQDATVEQIKELVNAYNSVSSTLRNYGERDSAFSRNAGLEFRSGMTSQIDGITGSFKSLSSIGIKTNSETGQLQVDEAALKEVLADDPEAVAELFLKEDTGLVSRMVNIIERYTDSDGVIETSKDGLDARIKSIDSSIERINNRVDKYEERLRSQFNAMEQYMNELTNMSNQIASFLPSGTA